jgi:hypothetical protein
MLVRMKPTHKLAFSRTADGQSWGGCVAAETVLAHYSGTACLKEGLASVVLSGAPSSPMM